MYSIYIHAYIHTPKQQNRANRVRRSVSFQAVLTPKASTIVTCPTALQVTIQMTKASVSVYRYHPLLPIAFNDKPLLSRGINIQYYIYSYFSKCLKKSVSKMCIKDWLHSWSMHNQLHLYLDSYKLIVLYQIFLGTWPPKCTCSCSDGHEWSDPHNVSYNCSLKRSAKGDL